MTREKQLFISAVCYLDGTEPFPVHEAKLIRESLARNYAYVEIILISGAHDGAWNACVEIAKALPDIRAYRLTGNPGENVSLTWGLEMSIGDMAVTCRLMPGFHVGVVSLVEAALAGTGLACAVRKPERGWIADLSARTTRVLTGVEYDPTTTPYWAVSRTLLNQVLGSSAIDSSLPVRILSLGKPVSRVVAPSHVPPMTVLAGLVVLVSVMIRVSPLPGRCLAAFSLAALVSAAIVFPDNLPLVAILGAMTQVSLLAISEAKMTAKNPAPAILAEAQSHSFLRDQEQLNTVVG